MILIASIIDQFGAGFLEQYKDRVLPGHKRAMAAMGRCRKEHGPHMLAQCTNHNCGKLTYIPHSCGHRSCPHCQNHESHQWIDNQLAKLVPARYFLITFTLPGQLRNLAWRHQRKIYSLMFTCLQDTLKTFTSNDKNLDGEAGFTAILHSHSRKIDYHPHIHVVMPAAGFNKKTRLWRTKKSNFLFSHKALAKVFRAKMMAAIVANDMPLPRDCPKRWVVDCKNVGQGSKALIYLGRYLYRGVIQEKDILRCEDGMVTFRYMHARTKRYKTRTVTGVQFLYLLMLHVLPKGFRRTRTYGFLHQCNKKIINLLQLIQRINPARIVRPKKQRPKITCPACGAKMKIIQTMLTKPQGQRQTPPGKLCTGGPLM